MEPRGKSTAAIMWRVPRGWCMPRRDALDVDGKIGSSARHSSAELNGGKVQRHQVWQTLACVAFGTILGSRAAAETSSSEAPALVWSFDAYRPTVSTPDGRFSFTARARFQIDGVIYDDDVPPDFTSGGLIRRA